MLAVFERHLELEHRELAQRKRLVEQLDELVEHAVRALAHAKAAFSELGCALPLRVVDLPLVAYAKLLGTCPS